jgi:hypothetical protein
MRTMPRDKRRVPRVSLGRSVWVLLIATGALPSACSAAGHSPAGPRPEPPEYMAPRVLPWDAGSPPKPEDPFAGAAVGDWLPPSGSKGAAIDAGSGTPEPSRAAEADASARPVEEAGGPRMRPLDAADAAADGHAP